LLQGEKVQLIKQQYRATPECFVIFSNVCPCFMPDNIIEVSA
jgi:hypothetical protein